MEQETKPEESQEENNRIEVDKSYYEVGMFKDEKPYEYGDNIQRE